MKTYIQNELDHAKQRVQEKELDMNIVIRQIEHEVNNLIIYLT